jgi:branched-chain amino acid transport system substrate-binding protein
MGTPSREFIKAGGKAVEGAIAPSGLLIVAKDLPARNPVKPVALDFKRSEQTFGEGSRNPFSGHSQATCCSIAAVLVAMKSTKLGTPALRRENGDWKLLK